MQIITLILALTVTNTSCLEDFAKAYDIAEGYIYPERHQIGPLLPASAHACDGWLPGYTYPGKVAVRPIYNDAGLPLYDMFNEENHELVGFEFRVLHIITHTCRLTSITKGEEAWECKENYHEYWNGYSIGLSERDKILLDILK